MTKTKVLFTNADNIRALLFLRALEQKSDLELHMAAERRFAACFLSKYSKHQLILPNPKNEPKKYLEKLKGYVENNKIDVLIPINADDLDLVIKNRNIFPEKMVLPFPDYSLFSLVKDKWEFYKIVKKLGLPSPSTALAYNTSQLKKLGLQFPLIVKIRKGAGSAGVKKVENEAELEATIGLTVQKFKLDKTSMPIVQQYLEGENYCVAAICRNGKVISISSYKNTRQLPINHGTGTTRISVKENEMERAAKKILENLCWHGIAQFDLIKRGKSFYFLEMNPRFYTSLSVTVKSGLNYPYFLCNLEKNLAIPKEYKLSTKCRILMPDTMVFLKSLFAKKRYPLREFFDFGKEVYIDDFSLEDPLPSIALIIKFIRGKLI